MTNRNYYKPYRAPLSGPIIGELVKLLQLDLGSDRIKKNAQRFFRNGTTSDARKLEVFDAIGAAVADLGLIPELPFMEREKMTLDRTISLCLTMWSKDWDGLVGRMRASSAPVDRPDLAAVAYFRLAIIDLALRVSAVLWLADTPTPEEGEPAWVQANGGSDFLKQLISKAGITHEEFSDIVNVSPTATDNWLYGNTRPHAENILMIAEKLAPLITGYEVDDLSRKLHLHYILCSIGDFLESHIGRDHVIELGTALMRFVSRNLAGLREFSKLPYESAAKRQVFVLIHGVRFIACEHLLRALWRQEEDPVWSADLDAAFKPWDQRLTNVLRNLGALDEAVQRTHEYTGIPKEFIEVNLEAALRISQSGQTSSRAQEITELEEIAELIEDDVPELIAEQQMRLAIQARDSGDFVTAVDLLREAVAHEPDSSWYHFHLGGALGELGVVEEGILECQIATQLDDSWELPKVEVGIILLNADRPDEAREHLEAIALNDEDPSSHLALNLGVARRRTGDHEGALQMLEIAIAKSPDNGMALDNAAHCAFVTGNPKWGRSLVKRARNLGYDETYQAWREGKYLAKNLRKAGVHD